MAELDDRLQAHIDSVLSSAPSTEERLDLGEEQWLANLGPGSFAILRKQGTEPPFSGALLHNGERGTYHCAGCDNPLFTSREKFDSGSGWPSFYRPIETGRLRFYRDGSFGMVRQEARCARCDGHLGHLFEDGPPPTGKRYCINSLSLKFLGASP